MKYAFRGVSGAALLLGLSTGLNGAWAQQPATPAAPANPNQTVTTAQPQTPATAPAAQAATDQTSQTDTRGATDRVTVTGTLLATAPEDAPRPVEVYSKEDLEAQGAPSINEFLRDLPLAFETTGLGEAIPGGAAATGFNSPNLRGLGANATLTLFNGRRLASTNGGAGPDINTLPTNALQAVEIMTGGASSTYGAGAVAGVINYITRRNVDAPEITFEQRFYDKSAPETNATFLTGWVGDAANIMFDYEYGHTSRLSQAERDFSSRPFSINPDVWTLDATSPGKYTRVNNFFGTTAPTVPTGTTNPDRIIQDYDTRASCNAIGGEIANIIQPNRSIAGLPNTTGTVVTPAIPDMSCVVPQFAYEDLVNESESHKVYFEANADISDTMSFHVDTLYSKVETITRAVPFPVSSGARGVAALPGTTGVTTAPTASATLCGTTSIGCQFFIANNTPTYINTGTTAAPVWTINPAAGSAAHNPFIDDFVARTALVSLGANDVLFTGPGWRPFGAGGNFRSDDGLYQWKAQRERFLINTNIKGDFQSDNFLRVLNGMKYETSAQFNFYDQTLTYPDIIVSRLQNALLGYGGPECRAIDRIATDYANATTYDRTVGVQSDTRAGTNGCQFFNPFASNFQKSVASGLANPQFNAALPQNSAELLNWLYRDRVDEQQTIAVTFDTLVSGTIPAFQLPGGEIAWGLGSQWRQVERRNGLQPESGDDRAFELQYCPWPGDPDRVSRGLTATGEPLQSPGNTGCATTGPGVYLSGGRTAIDYNEEQTLAFHGQLDIPVLDTLNFQASARRESYNNEKLVANIWNVAGKWDVTDNIYLRADYGTDVRAQGLNAIPGDVVVSAGTVISARFPGVVPQLFDVTDTQLGPEEDKTFNIGIGYHTEDLFGGRFKADVKFFELIIDGELAGGAADTQPLTLILNSIWGPSTANAGKQVLGGPTNPSTQTNVGCNSPLLQFVALNPAVNGGNCADGTAAHPGVVTTGNDLIGISRLLTNGGGFIANGIDYSVDYSHDLFDGVLSLSATATQNLVYKVHGYDIGGVPFAPDGNRLGYRNQNVGSGGNNAREWRLQASTRWSNRVHTFNLTANFSSGVKDAGYYACLSPYYNNATEPGQQVSTIEQFFTCGDSLTPVNINTDPNPARFGLALTGEDAYSTYGVFPKDRVTFNFSYIYRPTYSFLAGTELRASVVNVTDEDPVYDQTRRGFSTGDPRGRILELEVTKKF